MTKAMPIAGAVLFLLVGATNVFAQTDKPYAVRETTISLPIPVELNGELIKSGGGDALTTASLWLHARGKSNCYYVKDVHEYEAFVNTSKDPNAGPRISVDKIALSFQIAGDHGTETCANREWCAKTIEEYNTYCRTPRCVSAKATQRGGTWGTGQACW